MHGVHMLLGIAAALYFLSLLFHVLKLRTASTVVLAAGFAVHTAYQVSRGWLGGVFLPGGMVDGMFLMPWMLAAVVLLSGRFSRAAAPWGSGAVLVCLFSVLALLYPKGIIPPTPNKTTVLAYLFFLAEVAGQACFYLGAWFAALHLLKKSDADAFHPLLVWGFVFFSAAQVIGALWAYLGWGAAFRWGPRHLQSAVIWMYFAAYLHMAFITGWRLRTRAWFAAFGFFVTALCGMGSSLNEMRLLRIGG